MKRDDIKKAFEAVEPIDEQKQRMLNNVLYHSDNERKVDLMLLFKPKRIVTALVMIIFVAVSVFVFMNYIDFPSKNSVTEGKTAIDNSIGGEKFIEDSIAPLINQFKINNKTYILLSDDYKADVNFPKTISPEDIGEKITTIESSVDASLKGCDVYAYKPAGSQAVVAVKKENEYRLFKFLAFDSYNNNQDEDVAAYLNLFGIKSATDIKKIQFIGHSEQAKLNGQTDINSEIVERTDIEKFYGFYSVIKNSSDKYFEKLFNYKSNVDDNNNKNVVSDVIPPDYIAGDGADVPVSNNVSGKAEYAQDSVGVQAAGAPQKEPYLVTDNGATTSAGSSGTNALSNSVTIRIYNQSGLYFDAEYYPNIGFISRHEVNSEFADFLASFIK